MTHNGMVAAGGRLTDWISLGAGSITGRTGRPPPRPAPLLWRVKADLRLPVLELLPDGSYLSVVARLTLDDKARDKLIAAAHAGERLDPSQAMRVRVPGDTGTRYHRPPTIRLINLPATVMINLG